MLKAADVADYILEKCGAMSSVKLQKLVYYAQAWYLVWNDEPLFEEEIQAWVGGPVVVTLYNQHRGIFKLNAVHFQGDTSQIDKETREDIDKVLEFYAHRDAQWLSDLTHMEAPWKEARKGLSDGERGKSVISHASISEYYSSIPAR